MHSKLNPRIKNRAAAKERKVTKKIIRIINIKKH